MTIDTVDGISQIPENDPNLVLRAAVAVEFENKLVTGTSYFLVVKRTSKGNEGGKWEFPGGRIEGV